MVMKDPIKQMMAFGNRLNPGWAEGITVTSAGDDQPANLGVHAIREAARVLERFEEATAGLEKSDSLTDKGKRAERSRHAAKALEELDKATGTALSRLGKKRDLMRNSAKPVHAIEDPAARSIVYASVWQMLAAQGANDPLKVEIMARAALERGDAVSLEAILSLPTVHGGALSEAKVEELRAAQLESANPKLAGALGAINEVADDAEHVVSQVRAILTESAGAGAEVVPIRGEAAAAE